MKNTPPEDLLAFLKQYSRFFILGHAEPDGDCLGSQMAMALLMEKKGAEAFLYSHGPFRRPEIKDYEDLFAQRIPPGLLKEAREGKSTAVLIMDCSTLDRIGDGLREDIQGLPAAVIDHHASGDDFGTVRWIVPNMPSVTVLVHRLFLALDVPIDKKEAELLFLGLCTDTGYFRHLEEGSGKIFALAADLVHAGVNPKRIFNKMHGNRSLASRILLGRLLARTEALLENRVLVTWETLEEKALFGEDNRDSDILYQQLQSVKECEVVILIREESETERSVGLRSNSLVDVGSLSAKRGGGGHARAAGYTTTLEKSKIIADLLGNISTILL